MYLPNELLNIIFGFREINPTVNKTSKVYH